MKQLLRSLLLFCLLLNGCSKKEVCTLPPTGNSFSDSVFGFLNAHLSQDELSQLSPENYVVMKSRSSDLFILLYYRNSNQALLVERTTNDFIAHKIRVVFSAPGNKSGELLTEDLLTKKGHRINFTNGRVRQMEPTVAGKVNAYAISQSMISPGIAIVPQKTEPIYQELPAVYVVGGGSGTIDLASLYYLTDLNASYYYSYTTAPVMSPGGNGGGGGGRLPAPSASAVVNVPMLPGANKPIDINKELECFSNKPGAKYTLSINVNQPDPNTSSVVSASVSSLTVAIVNISSSLFIWFQ